jgi:hypothetical protein
LESEYFAWEVAVVEMAYLFLSFWVVEAAVEVQVILGYS